MANYLTNYRSLLLFFIILTMSAQAMAVRVPQKYRQTAAVQGSSFTTLNDLYGERIYWRSQYQNIILNTSTGNTLTYDYNELIGEALSEWKDTTGLVFERTEIEEDSNLNFSLTPTMDGGYGNTITGWDSGISWVYIRDKFFAESGLNQFQKAKDKHLIPEEMTEEEYIRMLLRITVKHEIGHALGLLHRDQAGQMIVDGLTGEVIADSNRDITPSIMIDSAELYLSVLSHHLGREVNIADVTLSPVDLLAARSMLAGRPIAGSCLSPCLALLRHFHRNRSEEL